MLCHLLDLLTPCLDVPGTEASVGACRDDLGAVGSPLEVKYSVLVASENSKVLTIAMNMPEEDILVMGPGCNHSPCRIELHGVDSTLVASEEHDR